MRCALRSTKYAPQRNTSHMDKILHMDTSILFRRPIDLHLRFIHAR
ncbi:hypothetical protein [Rubritalea tangerina]